MLNYNLQCRTKGDKTRKFIMSRPPCLSKKTKEHINNHTKGLNSAGMPRGVKRGRLDNFRAHPFTRPVEVTKFHYWNSAYKP